MSNARLAGILLVIALAGCARPPQEGPVAGASGPASVHPAGIDTKAITGSIAPAVLRTELPPKTVFRPKPDGTLAGRTIAAATRSDIALNKGEVILTFDDGPRPGSTDGVLEALKLYGVNATFLMVGKMADAYPKIAQRVALSGNTIGTHTYDHSNLANLGEEDAMADIRKGEAAVSNALRPIDRAPSPFFRFPYLAQTQFLRTSMAIDHSIVLDVQIDSKDFYDSTPKQVLDRTLKLLDTRGSGIILFHDIHARTVAMLPEFLQSLQDKGYSVVRLTAKGNGVFDKELITAKVE